MTVLASVWTTDRDLAAKAAHGDQDAFEQIVFANQNKVYSLCLRLVNNRDDAADLAQEVFLKAWQSLSNFRGDSSLSTWLHRMATNLCICLLYTSKVGLGSVIGKDELPWRELLNS